MNRESDDVNYTEMPDGNGMPYTAAPETNYNNNTNYDNNMNYNNNTNYDNNMNYNNNTNYDNNNYNNNSYYNGEAPDYSSGKGQGHGFGIAAMICGIISLIGCCIWFVSIPAAIAAIILGIVQIVKNQPKGMAIAGIVCGVFGLLLTIITVVASLLFMNSVAENPQLYEDMMDRIMQEYGVTEDMLEEYGVTDEMLYDLEGL